MSPPATIRTLTRSIAAWKDSLKAALPAPLGRLVRIAIVSPYNIIHEYIEADDAVTIMRIVHGRRRITRRMLNRPTTPP